MSKKRNKTTAQWIEYIAQEELPAITSTAHLLETFANDEVSSLPKLSQTILHDQGLSSCIIKVANNISPIGHAKITTVSRAAVVLGIQTVKNICLTAKVLEGLLKSETLSPDIYDRLTRLMATSFYSGLLARMMVDKYNDDTKEQVYLAAMLYRIGETAFWSSGAKEAQLLIEHIHLPQEEFDQKSLDIMGSTFSSISKGLASSWGLGKLLEKALDQPECRTTEIQIIALADKLGGFIDSPPDTIEEFNDVLEKVAAIKKITVRQLKEKVTQVRESAMELLSSFGANILSDLIKPLPTPSCFSARHRLDVNPISKDQAQLETVMQLTHLTYTSRDFNEYLLLVLKSAIFANDFSCCHFYMLSNDKKTLQARFSYDRKGKKLSGGSQIYLSSQENVFSYTIKAGKALLINNYRAVKWRPYLTYDIEKLIDEGAICLAPIKINHNVIGVIVACTSENAPPITKENFNYFSYLTEHLNMCLSLMSK